MGVPTQSKRLYRDALGGYHEVPQTTTLNGLGQQVMNSGIQYTLPKSYATSTPRITVGTSGGGAASGATDYLYNPKQGALAKYKDALSSAQDGVASAQAAADAAKARITNSAETDLNAARIAAGNIGLAAASLAPYEKEIAGSGRNLLSLYDQLMSGDVSRGGMGADFLNSVTDASNALLKINPDEYVSAAASDAQAGVQNSYGQSERELSRRGVGVGSGAYAALQSQKERALATLLASAKTAARRQGLSDQADALTKRAGLFQSVIQQAQSAAKQGTDDLASASSIVMKQGDMFGQQASAFANIGNVEVSFGNLELSSEKLVQDAIGNVTQMQTDMAKFYQGLLSETVTSDQWGNHKVQKTTVG